jgi:hypothetical protein
MKEKGMKTYYVTFLKGDDTAPRFPRFKNGDCIQQLVASIPDSGVGTTHSKGYEME